MSGLFAVALSFATSFIFARLFRQGVRRLAFVAITAGFGFWYWLPAANHLTIGYLGVGDMDFIPEVDAGCWFVLINQTITLALLALARPLFASSGDSLTHSIPVATLAQISFASALVYLAVRFAGQGSTGLIEVLVGRTSARADTSFVNTTQSSSESLLALWEIMTIWGGLFCLAWHAVQQRFFSVGGTLSVASLSLMYVGSGTRAVLMQGFFIFLLARLARSASLQRKNNARILRLVVFAAPMSLLAILVANGFSSRFGDESGYSTAGSITAVADTFFSHNDMMRELIFAFDTMQPSMIGAADFALTPFTYMLPTFAGFKKDIPEHLVNFNQIRAGIDLVLGSGNVFPGLVADFWLVFGYWGSILLACFLVLFSLIIDRLACLSADATAQLAFRLAGFSYIFFCFRNITGALGLALVVGALLLLLFRWWNTTNIRSA